MIDNVCVIIPAFNPDEMLFLNFIKEVVNNFSKVVVVNDGSDSEYDTIFQKIEMVDKKIHILKHSINLGKGRALKTAFNYVLNTFPNITGVVTADCDGQHGIDDVIKCAKELENNKNNLILGVRNFKQKDVPFKSRYGNQITKLIFKLFIGLNIQDTQTGLRAIGTDLMKLFMSTKGERYEYETNMLIDCKQKDIPINQVQISTIYIEKNQTSKFNPIKDSLTIYKLFAKYILSSISSFVIDFVLFYVLLGLLNKNHVPCSIILATIIARIISSICNFKLNANMVFKKKRKGASILYLILVLVQMLVSALGVNYLTQHINVNVMVIKIIVDVIIFMVNFVIQREFIFK